MNQPTKLAELKQSAVAPKVAPIVPGFGSSDSFELMVRQSKLLMSTTLVPAQYRSVTEKKGRGGVIEYIENPNALANCCVALNMAQRMNADPLMVMQNLYIVEGRPSWSSQWIIASINSCGRFSPLRFDLEDLGEKEVEYTTSEWESGPNGNSKVTKKHKTTVRNLKCIAWAVEKGTNERLTSPVVTVEMAVKEGWYGKNGSKWQTMPEVMLRYRCASFFGKLYTPELLMGIPSQEEAQEITIEAERQNDGSYAVTVDSLREAAAAAGAGEQMPGSIDLNTGEVMPPVATGDVIDHDDDQLRELEQAGRRPQASEGPTYEDAMQAVNSGEHDVALDIARGLPEGERKAIEQAIYAAKAKTQPARQQRSRERGDLGLD